MRDDLMAVEIEVHPFVARTSFGTAEQVAIEGAGFGKIFGRFAPFGIEFSGLFLCEFATNKGF